MARRRINLPKAAGRVQPSPSDLLRFFAKVRLDLETGCWDWTGHRDRGGYGQFRHAGRIHWAHRWAYLVFRCRLRDGDHVDHRCNNPSCVNPYHLVRMPMADHLADAARRRNQPAPIEDDIPI